MLGSFWKYQYSIAENIFFRKRFLYNAQALPCEHTKILQYTGPKIVFLND